MSQSQSALGGYSDLGSGSLSRLDSPARRALVEREVRAQLTSYISDLVGPDGAQDLINRSLASIGEDTLLPPRSSGGGAAALPPGTGLSRSASAPRLLSAVGARSMGSTPFHHGAPQSSHHSSHASCISAASLRSQIQQKVQQEVRSAMDMYLQRKLDDKQRARQKNLDRPLHLRTGTNPVTNGCPIEYQTQMTRSLKLPVSMAVDPKWSTELKRMNDKIGARAEYERRLSASVQGAMLPADIHMYPKKHLSNPPTPYWKPGQSNQRRSTAMSQPRGATIRVQ